MPKMHYDLLDEVTVDFYSESEIIQVTPENDGEEVQGGQIIGEFKTSYSESVFPIYYKPDAEHYAVMGFDKNDGKPCCYIVLKYNYLLEEKDDCDKKANELVLGILCHEVGHILKWFSEGCTGGDSKYAHIPMFNGGKINPDELFADDYAIKNGYGDALKNDLRTELLIRPPYLTTTNLSDIRLRIRHINGDL